MNNRPSSSVRHDKPQTNDYMHYVHLLLDKKYWIFLIILLTSVMWYFILPVILAIEKKYDFQAIIRFEDPRVRTRMRNVDQQLAVLETESRTRVIKTTTFLTRVVDSLNLNILSSTPGISRSDIFSDIILDKDPKYGNYIIKRDDISIGIYYTNEKENIENKLLQAYRFVPNKIFNFDINGLHLKIKSTVFDVYNKDKIEFNCIPTHYLTQTLRQKIHLRLNQQQTLLEISYEFSDPILGAQIVNTVADLFLKESVESKQFRTRSLLKSLEQQLQSSKKDLEQAENALRGFREKNPHIYLTENLALYNQRMTQEATTLHEIKGNLERLYNLDDEKMNTEDQNDLDLIYQEILSFLQEQRVAGITALSQQYQDVLTEKQQLTEQQYSNIHPRMVEVNSLIKSLQSKIDERLREYIAEQKNRIQQMENNISQSEQILSQSPRKELQLAKLQRDRDAKAEIYSNLLVRYNEVKVAHVSIVPDVELLQQAEVPIQYSSIMDQLIKLSLYLLGPILGLVFGIGLFVIKDFISYKARTTQDIENYLNIPVYSAVPMIVSDKGIPDDFNYLKRMDPKLVTIDFTPSAASEAFRNIRTRLILNKDEEEQLSFIVTSMSPDEGKSLVAANLAITFSQLKKPTLLVDADLRRGVVHNSFLVNKKPGLADILASRNPIDMENIYKIIQKSTIPNLHIISKGKDVPNPSELLMGQRVIDLINHINKYFQYIIFDTPPFSLIPDALVINKIVNHMLIVTRYGMTDVKKLRTKINEIDNMKESIDGLILNGIVERKSEKYSSYSYYKY